MPAEHALSRTVANIAVGEYGLLGEQSVVFEDNAQARLKVFDGVGEVRQGKYIEIDLVDSTEAAAQKKVAAMCRQLLANTVIENYIIEIEA